MSYFWAVYAITLTPIIMGSTYFIKMSGLIGTSYLISIGVASGNIGAILLSSFNQKYGLLMWYGLISIGIMGYLFMI